MSKFALGDIVTLLTHPFIISNTEVIISGEHLLTPPTMVVLEIIARPDSSYENSDSYKCIWFSSKKNDFPDNWFNENELKKLDQEEKNPEVITVGCRVTLNNLSIELGKRRSYLQIDAKGSAEGKKTSSISAHLPFVSPVMLVLSIEDFNREKLKKGTSTKDKIFPRQWVKCKYYNAFSEKFSEVILPIEVLTVVPSVNDELLSSLKKLIKNSGYMKFNSTILKPIDIFNKSGEYILSSFDLVSQKYDDCPIHKLPAYDEIKKPYLDSAPTFEIESTDETKRLVPKKDVNALIKEVIDSGRKNYLVIKYTDKFGNFTTRTVLKYQIVTGPDDLAPEETTTYLNAYCKFRNDIRNFKIKSISEVSILDVVF